MTVNVPLEKMFRAITDYEAYPRISHMIQKVQILESEDSKVKARFDLEMIKQLYYEIEIQSELSHDKSFGVIEWSLIRSDLLTRNNGKWELSAMGNSTEVTYSLDIDFNMPVPGFMKKKMVAKSLPKTIEEFRDYASDLNDFVENEVMDKTQEQDFSQQVDDVLNKVEADVSNVDVKLNRNTGKIDSENESKLDSPFTADNIRKAAESFELPKPVESVIKKAVDLGAGLYFTAEDKVHGTLNKSLKPIKITREVIRQAIEDLFESYTLSVNAEIKLKPKNPAKKNKKENQ